MKKILYVCYGGGHANMILPVYRFLEKKGYTQVVCALTTARAFLERQGVQCFSFRDIADASVLEIGRELIKDQPSHPDVPYEESAAYYGLSFRDLIAEFGEREAEARFRQEGRQAFLPRLTMHRLFEREKPDLVVSTSSPRAERAALLVAREIGLLSLCLADLFGERDIRGILSAPGYGSKICVLSEMVKEALIEAGRPADEIVVTGNPAFDSIMTAEQVESGRLYRQEKGIEDRIVVLMARSVMPVDAGFEDQIETRLREIVSRDERFALIVRPHPNEIRPSSSGTKNTFVSLKNEHIATVLHAADVVCHMYSTVGVQAYILGKKVIQPTYTHEFGSLNCVKPGMSVGAPDLNAVADEVLNSKRAQPLELEADSATPRVCKMIEQMLGMHPRG